MSQKDKLSGGKATRCFLSKTTMSEKKENEAVVCLLRAGGPDWSPRKLLKRFSIFSDFCLGLV